MGEVEPLSTPSVCLGKRSKVELIWEVAASPKADVHETLVVKQFLGFSRYHLPWKVVAASPEGTRAQNPCRKTLPAFLTPRLKWEVLAAPPTTDMPKPLL